MHLDLLVISRVSGKEGFYERINFYMLLEWGHLPFAKISKRFKKLRRYYLGQPGPANMEWFDFAKWGFPELKPEDIPNLWDPVSEEDAMP